MSDTKSPLTRAQHDRRDRIIDAGLALLADRDYDKIQVKDVAEEANVALGTLYRYFSSKEHLFAEVLIAWAATLAPNISRNPLRGRSDAARLTEVLQRSVRAFERQPQLARLVATLETTADTYASQTLAELRTATTPVYVAAMQDVDPARAEAIVRVVDAVLASGLRSWVSGRISIGEVNDRLAEAVKLFLP
jgi:AcrR family transcriptional regulator